MSDINDIISVDIAIEDSAPKAVAFDTPLILAKAPYSGAARLYDVSPAGLAEMVTDGFTASSRAYQIMSAMKKQSGGVGQAYIFGRTTQFTQSLEMIPDITVTSVGFVINFDISYNGTTSSISYTVVTNTVDAILDGIEALIDASAAGLAGITTTPDNATATKLALIPGTAGKFVQLDGFGREIHLTEAGVDGSIAAQLAVAKADLGEAVYGLLLDSSAETENNLAATFAEANDMLFLANSQDNGILVVGTTTDVASDFKGSGYNRSAVCFSRYMQGDFAAALLGRQLGQTPGSSNWAGQTLAGLTGDRLTSAAHSSARGKRALTYTTDRNVAHTWDGFAASGRYFDVQHGADALKADMQTRAYQVWLNAEKVPFNATGRTMYEQAIRAALVAAEGTLSVPGLLEPGWEVIVPDLVGYSTVDKAARLLKTFRFSGVLTGAVNSVEIEGTLRL